MAASRTYVWAARDDLWLLAARYLVASGYETVGGFVDAIRAANPQVLVWPDDLSAGDVLTIPALDT